MKIYDISREVFSAAVYPGDPIPNQENILAIKDGACCNLSRLELGSHSATHLDAPLHFIPNGKGVEEIDLQKCIGKCKVISRQGYVGEKDIEEVISDGCKKLLIKGEIEIGLGAARSIAEHELELLGVEGTTVGTTDTSQEIHRVLLNKEVVIVEALNLQKVPDGDYLLFAAPLKLAGVDGSPCRAVLISEMEDN